MPDKEIPKTTGQPMEHPVTEQPPTEQPVVISNNRRALREVSETRRPPIVIQDSKVNRAVAKFNKIAKTERILARDKASLTNMIKKLTQDEFKAYQEGIKQK